METCTVVFVVVQKAKRLRSRAFFGAYLAGPVEPSPVWGNLRRNTLHLFFNPCPFKGTLLEAPIHAGFDESFPTFGERPLRLGSP